MAQPASPSPSERRELDQAIDRLLLDRFSRSERRQLRQAADFAVERHGNQRRASGELFVLHPLAVALILAEENLSVQTVIAGILHDVVEDTETTIEEVAALFGEEVAALVEGVTKVTRLSPRRSRQKHKTETYRKLILAAVDDARVLVVKLADRLHNLRTISALPYEKRRRIATETMEIYAPLAHRLGMSSIRSELEDRSLAIVDPAAYEEAGMIQAEAARRSEDELQEISRRLRRVLKKHRINVKEVKSRLKSRASIAEKIHRGGQRREIEDVIGLRIIVESVDECYRTLGLIHRIYPPKAGSFDDYIAVPRANLYKSLHTTVNADGRLVEIQIRTVEMDEVAEHGIAAHWIYKDATLREGGPPSTQSFLARAAENQQGAGELEEAFAALRADFFAEEIYVFTPRGEVKVLPAGSCAIDFAYTIHSEIGDRITGARVDGRLTSITRPLEAGQVVEVITGKHAHPSLDWLPHVKTARARQQIRSFHSAELEEERTAKGLALLREELKRLHAAELSRGEAFERALAELGYDKVSAAADAMRDRSRARFIARRIVAIARVEEGGEEKPREQARPATAPARPTTDIEVDGMEKVATRLAGCCQPEPGDQITGYVSVGHGVTVHRNDCQNLKRLAAEQKERIVEVRWIGEGPRSFRAELELRFVDRPRLLEDIADAVYSVGAELIDLNMNARVGVVSGRAAFEVTSPEQSEELRQSLSAIKGALNVARVGRG